MQKVDALKILSNKVANCNLCQELATTRTQTVFSDGNPNSSIVFVAEAPGKEEDLQGIPLVGRSGKLLNSALDGLGINRQDIYICNILKCRPPNNRTPTEVECNNCKPFFDLQLKLIDPKIIVCLGSVAASNILQTFESISSLRGRVHKIMLNDKNVNVICWYHPSFILRGNKKDLLFEDMNLLKQLL